MNKSLKKIVTIVVAILLCIVVVLNSFTTIKPTQRGITVTLGKASDKILEPGLHFKAPFVQAIRKYSVSPTGLKVSFGIGEDGVVTSDLQTIGLESTVYWVYDETVLVEAIKKYDNSSISSMLKTAMLSSVKEVLGHYTVQEIIENQTKVTAEIKESMVSKMSDKPVNITMVTVSNYNWSADYDKMINQTMLKKQQVKQAEQEVQITELNAQKNVKEAEAQKQAQIVEAEAQKMKMELEAEANLIKTQKETEANLLRAEAEAKAKKLEADAMAYYYEQLAKNLETQTTVRTLEINLERAKNWDGREVPNYIPLTVNGTPIVVGK